MQYQTQKADVGGPTTAPPTREKGGGRDETPLWLVWTTSEILGSSSLAIHVGNACDSRDYGA